MTTIVTSIDQLIYSLLDGGENKVLLHRKPMFCSQRLGFNTIFDFGLVTYFGLYIMPEIMGCINTLIE